VCAELDVVDVKIVEDDDAYIVVRMTWAQHRRIEMAAWPRLSRDRRIGRSRAFAPGVRGLTVSISKAQRTVDEGGGDCCSQRGLSRQPHQRRARRLPPPHPT
jgi:hypothetical protein